MLLQADTNGAGIYCVLDLRTTLAYIGSSRHIAHRWIQHKSKLRNGVHSCHALQQAWNASAEQFFVWIVLESCGPDRDVMIAREQWWIDHTPGLYNVAPRAGSGPKGGACFMSPDGKERMRQANRRPKSTEHRARLSASRSGRKFPKHAEAIRGKKASPETRAKMSASHKKYFKENPNAAVHREKLRAAAKTRKPRTPEHSANIAAAKQGTPWSAARRAAHKPPTAKQLAALAVISAANRGKHWSPARRAAFLTAPPKLS